MSKDKRNDDENVQPKEDRIGVRWKKAQDVVEQGTLTPSMELFTTHLLKMEAYCKMKMLRYPKSNQNFVEFSILQYKTIGNRLH